jgi:hypothetical protein
LLPVIADRPRRWGLIRLFGKLPLLCSGRQALALRIRRGRRQSQTQSQDAEGGNFQQSHDSLPMVGYPVGNKRSTLSLAIQDRTFNWQLP